MSNLQLPCMSFENLSTMRVPASGKIAHNTWIRRNSDNVEVIYHTTVIATIYRDKVIIANGGWATRTTADRINAVTEKVYTALLVIREAKPKYSICEIVRGDRVRRGDKVEPYFGKPDKLQIGK